MSSFDASQEKGKSSRHYRLHPQNDSKRAKTDPRISFILVLKKLVNLHSINVYCDLWNLRKNSQFLNSAPWLQNPISRRYGVIATRYICAWIRYLVSVKDYSHILIMAILLQVVALCNMTWSNASESGLLVLIRSFESAFIKFDEFSTWSNILSLRLIYTASSL